MVRMGFIDQIYALLHSEHDASHEHLASALLALISSNDRAKEECRRQELAIQQLAQERIERFKDQPKHSDEVFRDILKECF